MNIGITQKQLDALRLKYRAISPAGFRCSNLIEQLKVWPDADPDHKKILLEFMKQQVEDLNRLPRLP